MSRIRFALIGAGRIADLHVPGYEQHPRGELALVCDARAEVARRRAFQWGVPRWCTDPGEVFADPSIDAVEILTPHHLHAPLTIRAARAGKHVSVQKPMALDLGECDAMIAACREAGVVLRVYENFVFYPPYIRARALIDEGAIGEPQSIRFKLGACGGGWHVPLGAWLWRLDAAEGGGGPTIFDDGYHKLSMAIELLGPVESVGAWIEPSVAVADTPAVLDWRYADGRRVGFLDATFSPNLELASSYYAADERVEIVGTHGWIRIARCSGRLDDRPALLVHRAGRTVAHEDLETDWLASFRAATGHFIDALANGAPPHLDGARGRDVTRFALAAGRAAELGRRVRLDELEAGGSDA